MKNLLFVLFFAIVSVSFAQNHEWKKPEFQEFKLENGLTVILNEDHLQPYVFGGVVTRAGAKDDPANATGMAHYMEHMLFKGTESMCTVDWTSEKPIIDKIILKYDELAAEKDPEKKKAIQKEINDLSLEAGKYAIPNEMDKLLKGIGSTNINAFTGPDITMFFNKFPSAQIYKWLDIYAHRFHKPVFRGFQAELEVVYEEKNMYSDMFQFTLLEEFNKQFFKVHPYGQQPLIGTMEHLKNPSLSKMYEFYHNWYVPSNMALIISGDFKTEEILPFIKEKFGVWEDRPIPERKKFEEAPLNGREFIERKLSPVKLGIIGYRVPPAGHADELPVELISGLLNNSAQTGLFDKLSLDNKLLAAQCMMMPYNDYGEGIIFFIPKIVGQKLEDAEQLVMDELKKIAAGDFSDEDLDRLKKEKYVEYILSLESPQNRVIQVGQLISQNLSYKDLVEYPDRIMRITREDIITAAKKYFGENRLVMYSKMGFPKKEKIEKPGFKPLVANTGAESEFARSLAQQPEVKADYKFINFESDIKSGNPAPNILLYYGNNPVNPIFSCSIRFGVGNNELPLLKYGAQMMNMAGTKDQSVSDFKKQMASIGCSYNFTSDESFFTIELKGLEENMALALKYINGLLNDPKIEPEKMKMLYDQEKGNRQMEKAQPDNVADALFDWMRYGSKSDYLDRLTLKEIKELKTDSLLAVILKATGYGITVHYCGRESFEVVNEIFAGIFGTQKKVNPSKSPVVLDISNYNENQVFFVNKSGSTQSKIYFMINTPATNAKEKPVVSAFNLYFGGDFSGLVMQYVREYRSMAYSAGAVYRTSILNGRPSNFMGFIGTQADKTVEAVSLFDSLVRVMPLFPERMEGIRNYLIHSSVSERPSFRELTETIEKWRWAGYEKDPLEFSVPAYHQMQFDEIHKFNTQRLAKAPMVIGIVGNKKNIDMKKLAGYGKITEKKEKELFRD